MEFDYKSKMEQLKNTILSYGSAAVAFSGGTDSTLLLKAASDCLGTGLVVAVTVASELLPASELAEAKRLAQGLGVQHYIVACGELEEEQFTANTSQRCYYCKYLRYQKLLSFAREKGLNVVLDGINVDDCQDFRPGTRAIRELGIKTPLLDVGLNKKEIRLLSKQLGLANWSKPAAACLASRISYGEKITREKLLVIEKAEDYLKELNLGQIRVRCHGTTARIEVDPDRFGAVVKISNQIVEYIKALGFKYVTLDLQGFRSGSMNEQL